jgi:hypothetical protein
LRDNLNNREKLTFRQGVSYFRAESVSDIARSEVASEADQRREQIRQIRDAERSAVKNQKSTE